MSENDKFIQKTKNIQVQEYMRHKDTTSKSSASQHNYQNKMRKPDRKLMSLILAS